MILAERARLAQDGTRAEDESALQEGVVEDVGERAGKGECRDERGLGACPHESGVCPQAGEAEAEGDDAHVFDGGEGEQLLEVDLRQREENAAERAENAENKQNPTTYHEHRGGLSPDFGGLSPRGGEADEAVEAERDHCAGQDGRGGRGGGRVRFGQPHVEGREADLEAEADDGAEESGERAVRPTEENAREHERTGARVAGEEVDPGGLADGLLGVLEGDESGRGEAHRLPGEEESQHAGGENDAGHRRERRDEEEPEARLVTARLAVEIGRRMEGGGQPQRDDGHEKESLKFLHGMSLSGR